MAEGEAEAREEVAVREAELVLRFWRGTKRRETTTKTPRKMKMREKRKGVALLP